jgi:hypothetical protein
MYDQPRSPAAPFPLSLLRLAHLSVAFPPSRGLALLLLLAG